MTNRTLDALSARRAERVHTRLHGKKPPRRRQKRNIETTSGAVACCAKPLCGQHRKTTPRSNSAHVNWRQLSVGWPSALWGPPAHTPAAGGAKNTFAPTGGYLIMCSRELLGLAFGLSCEAEDLGGGCHGRGERERQAEEKESTGRGMISFTMRSRIAFRRATRPRCASRGTNPDRRRTRRAPRFRNEGGRRSVGQRPSRSFDVTAVSDAE